MIATTLTSIGIRGHDRTPQFMARPFDLSRPDVFLGGFKELWSRSRNISGFIGSFGSRSQPMESRKLQQPCRSLLP